MMDLFRLREFRAFLVANTFERFAAAGMTVLLGYQVYEIRHDPMDLGWLGLVEAIPGITLVLYGGHVADQHGRRRIVLVTTGLLALLAAVLALTSAVDHGLLIAVLFVVAFLSACIRAFESPAAIGLEALVLPRDKVLRGVPIIATCARTADVVGPVAVGFLWAWLGPVGAYSILAALFAAACVLLWWEVAEKPASNLGAPYMHPVRRITEGVRYVFSDQILYGSMALDLFAVFFGGAAALLPMFATDILHVGPEGFGLLRSAIAAGALVSAVLATRYLPVHRAGLALHLVVAGFGISIIVFGLSTSFLLSLAALFAAGVCDGLSMVIRHAILRLASPESMRGRIAAVRMVFVGSSNELGALESGLAASLLGASAAVCLGGAVTIAIVVGIAFASPRLLALDLDTLRPLQPGERRRAPAAGPARSDPEPAE